MKKSIIMLILLSLVACAPEKKAKPQQHIQPPAAIETVKQEIQHGHYLLQNTDFLQVITEWMRGDQEVDRLLRRDVIYDKEALVQKVLKLEIEAIRLFPWAACARKADIVCIDIDSLKIVPADQLPSAVLGQLFEGFFLSREIDSETANLLGKRIREAYPTISQTFTNNVQRRTRNKIDNLLTDLNEALLARSTEQLVALAVKVGRARSEIFIGTFDHFQEAELAWDGTVLFAEYLTTVETREEILEMKHELFCGFAQTLQEFLNAMDADGSSAKYGKNTFIIYSNRITEKCLNLGDRPLRFGESRTVNDHNEW